MGSDPNHRILDREFSLGNGLIYTDDIFGILKLEDMNKSFECISKTQTSFIIDEVRKYGYSIDWGGEYVAWDKSVFSMKSIYIILESGLTNGNILNSMADPRRIYLNNFKSACRNAKLKDIGI